METIDLDIGDNFEGPFRARSNTWPLPKPELNETFTISTLKEENELNNSSANLDLSNLNGTGLRINGTETIIPTTTKDASLNHASTLSGPKKNSSRRNAWGNMSYSDLITQAIQSSPDQRLTLSQIYDWMVQNVAYFRDKGDSNSSAGWKNSIRHNLSLHSCFSRVQNEGTGKSSWWVVDPEAKPGKSARRRATSMETQKFEKKRGRVKKKVEALRNGLPFDTTPSPSSSVSEGIDMSPLHSFQMSPDFRPKTSSNASSCGRLSPIQIESDLHDSHIPPLSPLWNQGRLYSNDVQDQYNAEQLVELANTMKLGSKTLLNAAKSNQNETTLSSASSQNSINNNYSCMNNYAGQESSYNGQTSLNRNRNDSYFQVVNIDNNITLASLNSVTGPRSPSKLVNSESLNSIFNLNNISQSGERLSASSHPNSTMSNFQSPKHQPAAHLNQATLQDRMPYGISGIENNAIGQRANILNNPKFLSSSNLATNTSVNTSSLSSLGSTASQFMGHILSLNNPLPNDLDFDSIHGGLECDVDQVIRHELSVDGNLDFNFDSIHGSNASNTSVPTSMTAAAAAAAATSHSWVH